MAEPHEIELGRVLVSRGLVTQEQVLTTLRARNADPQGPDVGARMVSQGLVAQDVLDDCVKAVARGEGRQIQPRHKMSTDHQISLSSTREAIARDCLAEALRLVDERPEEALLEIRRLAEEFSDTESGNRAKEELAALEKKAGGAG